MVIDSTHRNWLRAALLLLAVASLGYIPYALATPQGPNGGSIVGLIYGIAGFLLMIFAGLLSFRKKVPVWRIGRAQTWMRGHLWLGLVSFPLILFHTGFRFGGALTSILMWLFIVVLVSGLVGAALQHYLPGVMQRELPMETVYEQIEHIREQLRAEAEELISTHDKDSRTAGTAHKDAEQAKGGTAAAVAVGVDRAEEEPQPLVGFYTQHVLPFLAGASGRNIPLAEAHRAIALFAHIRLVVKEELRPKVDNLESICDEERQLRRQERMHLALHGWLFLHVPLSFALLALGALHAVIALRY